VTQHPEARPKEAPLSEYRVHPETLAGDPFSGAGKTEKVEEHPHACWDGWVFLGYTDPETDEEHSEVLPCRRCAEVRS